MMMNVSLLVHLFLTRFRAQGILFLRLPQPDVFIPALDLQREQMSLKSRDRQ